MKKFIIASCATVSICATAFGWGQKGHDTVAAIAESHLTEATAAAADSLLNGMSLVYWANWLDNASHTPEYAYSSTWHYKNIDIDQTYDSAPDLETGNVVTALRKNIAILQSSTTSENEKALALKMLTHLMGDMHQPMHMGRKADRGGNRHKVKYFNRDNNLHSVWDSSIPESAHKWSYSEWRDQIDRLNDLEAEYIIAGDLDSWARETYVIATKVYDSTPEGTEISYDYVEQWRPTVETQLLRGGRRLAHILNSIFDPAYNGQEKF